MIAQDFLDLAAARDDPFTKSFVEGDRYCIPA
jgi:hypothetical protein